MTFVKMSSHVQKQSQPECRNRGDNVSEENEPFSGTAFEGQLGQLQLGHAVSTGDLVSANQAPTKETVQPMLPQHTTVATVVFIKKKSVHFFF